MNAYEELKKIIYKEQIRQEGLKIIGKERELIKQSQAADRLAREAHEKGDIAKTIKYIAKRNELDKEFLRLTETFVKLVEPIIEG